jgi:uncharacterized protein YbaR (Trm112 family)
VDVALVERLVCPRGHTPIPLVIRADAVTGGGLERGVLACPTCRIEWPVTNGTVRFGDAMTLSAGASPESTACAAFLNLTDAGALIVTDGASTTLCVGLASDFGSTVVPLDPEEANDSHAIYGAPTVPFGEGAVRGAVLLRAARSDSFIASAVQSLAPNARMVAAASIPMPAGMREIARDENLWIAEREPTPITARLARRR